MINVMPKKITIGEKYRPAMKITKQEEASSYFLRCVQHSMTAHGFSLEEAESVERQNLGYFAGYYDTKTRERVERLFSCQHPIFGAIATEGAPSNEEAFDAGKKMAAHEQDCR